MRGSGGTSVIKGFQWEFCGGKASCGDMVSLGLGLVSVRYVVNWEWVL